MNNGKICIPVCAPTADGMVEQIRRAETMADVIEVRFDCLTEEELRSQFQYEPDRGPRPNNSIIGATETPLLSTFRPAEQGGKRELTREERRWFWNTGYETEYCDVEDAELVDDSFAWLWEARICSWHDFSGEPHDLNKVFDRLAATDADILKIAVVANDIVDALPVWKLLQRATPYNSMITRPHVIPVAMGEAGKWTRVLGLAHGAFLTYASLEDGGGTADGQITAADMIDVYRVRELTPDTEVFGVIGNPVSGSLSPYMQNAAFQATGVDAVFMHLQVKDLDAFIGRMVREETREVELNFGGFSVTMPHKQAIMSHLDEIDETAKEIGAVNTVKIDGDRLVGYNTDAHGFITPLKARFGDLRGARAAVFGAGGAARAVVHALKQEGVDVTVFVRDPEKAAEFGASLGVDVQPISNFRSEISDRFDVVVNATPLGMRGTSEDKTILTADEISGVKFVFDLVTRIDETPLLREATLAGVPAVGGLEMLIAQGARQFEIWTGQTAPLEIMRTAVERKMKG